MRISLLPLDERPCNWKYVQMMTQNTDQLHLTTFPIKEMGKQKHSADLTQVNAFIQKAAQNSDALVIALDTLIYGGLIPSRIHHLSQQTVDSQLQVLRDVKKEHSALKIYAAITLMRSPQYNSAAEEPDYYAVYGYQLFRKAYLEDKKERAVLSNDEQTELNNIIIPDTVVDDYEDRRQFNEQVNLAVLQFVQQGIIDFLVIPQDDSAPFGYTAVAQRRISKEVERLNLEDRVNIYPGADEVGSTLTVRAFVDHMHVTPKIFAFYASTLGPSIIPLYEDRPMFETLKAHVRASGAQLVEGSPQADFVLAINSPGKVMQRAKDQKDNLDITYSSFRDLNDFVLRIKSYIDEGKLVAVCDTAFGNGGDISLLKRLDEHELLDKLLAYAGWNTNANSMGTVLADAIFNYQNGKPVMSHLVYRYIEDTLYQSQVRQDILNKVLPALGVDDYHLGAALPEVTKKIQQRLMNLYQQWSLASKLSVTIENVTLPWHRLFEVNFDLTIENVSS
jgi:hypothetical protein